MNLVIDQGNTLIKFGIFDNDTLAYANTMNFFDENAIASAINQYHIERSLFSSVKLDAEQSYLKLKKIFPNILHFTKHTELPFINKYETPETIGKDRLAAVAGAISMFPNTPVLVIDCGTALTFEFINGKGEYMGGNISPGINLRYRSLHEFTSKLPLLNKNDHFSFIGKSTNEAIISGVQNSIIFEIDEYIERYNIQFEQSRAIITGGDAEFFAGKLKNPIFVDLNLVHKGLNRILKHNA